VDDPMTKPAKLTHVGKDGSARMVDVGHKAVSRREATAEGYIVLQRSTVRAITAGKVPKGEVLNTARVAGIMAAKQCGNIIPMCHPLAVEQVQIDLVLPRKDERSRIRITATARITAKTGVEMEALTAVAVAALTIYDMCKAIDKTMQIGGIRLLSKSK
jgi:cyclic pyranopterin phosphate synthase